MEIFPLVAGLEVKAMFEEGLLFRKDVLQVDDAKMLSDLATASRQALSLAVKSRYFTPLSVRHLLGDAHKNAVNLSVYAEIPTKETVKLLLSKATAQASALKKKTGDA
jgi:large subunit ribosomal protein L10